MVGVERTEGRRARFLKFCHFSNGHKTPFRSLFLASIAAV